LALLTFASLGLWLGDPCTQHTSLHDDTARIAVASAPVPASATRPGRAPMPGAHDPTGLDQLSVADEPCHIPTSTVVSSTAPAAVAVAPPVTTIGPRTADVVARPVARTVHACLTLTEIGISRT
jgi:hypothetical protein